MVQSSGCLEGHILRTHVPLKKTLRLGWQMHVELNSATPTLATINFSVISPTEQVPGRWIYCNEQRTALQNRVLPHRVGTSAND